MRVAQGDLPGALAAYDESLTSRRDLAARDPGNAGWARDVLVSYWKLAQTDPANAAGALGRGGGADGGHGGAGHPGAGGRAHLDAARANLAAARR